MLVLLLSKGEALSICLSTEGRAFFYIPIMIKDDFYYEKPISITVEDGDAFTVFMRPLKLKDIPVLNRIIHLQEIDPDDVQASAMLINLMVSTLDTPGSEIPIEATTELVNFFLGLNFPKAEEPEPEDKDTAAREKLTPKPKEGIAACVDFLCRQGHSYTDIQEYTIPQFKKFIDIAAERLGIKKPVVSPEEAFRRLGIPIKPRNTRDN